MIKLVDVYTDGLVMEPTARFLYFLMEERDPEIAISHKKLPTYAEHVAFCNRHPYAHWYVIHWLFPKAHVGPHRDYQPMVLAGTISSTRNNEIGIVLIRAARARGLGPMSIRRFMAEHEPIRATPGDVHGEWLANIAPTNPHSQHVFQKLGFRKIQETYAKPHSTEETSNDQTEA